MKNSRWFISCILLTLAINGFSQNIGDTLVVQGFNYTSTTRDTVLQFPSLTPSQVERVWMRYNMRCKNAAVSSSSNTNLGCGEWDYSCNTYITDSSRIDSIPAKINRYIIYPTAPNDLIFATEPTWNIYAENHQEITLNAASNEIAFDLGNGASNSSNFIETPIYGKKSYILIRANELISSGLTAGFIDGLSLFNLGTGTALSDFKIALKTVDFTEINESILSDLSNLNEVYRNALFFENGEQKFIFQEAFEWDGTSHILVELTTKGSTLNQSVNLESDQLAFAAGMFNQENKYGRFITDSYVQTPGYLGIAGNAARTMEFRIKTPIANKTILSWGKDIQGQKFLVRLNNDGRIRLEINGGNVIGTTPLDDNEWHHVAIVFNGTSLSNVTFYLDGEIDPVANLTNLNVNTVLGAEVQLSKGFSNSYFLGNMDDVRIWSAALSQQTIRQYLMKAISPEHPNYSNLELNYVFEDGLSATVSDQSAHGRNGEFHVNKAFGTQYGMENRYQFHVTDLRPKIRLYQADYDFSVNTVPFLDSIPRESYLIQENQLTPNPGTLESDITKVYTEMWPDSSVLNDVSTNTSQSFLAQNTVQLTDNVVSYWNRTPSKIELLSFVTPYGINLNLGAEGKTWFFDVTDYLPILTGSKGISMERGGQWQEDMDIQFHYVIGTPVREVLDLRQVWKVDSRSYTSIMDNSYFPARTIKVVPGTIYSKVRAAISGHGQEGEFVPQNHFLNVNNGAHTFNWQVWKSCGENPVYPQGGTWIYDRAGWCPGMPTDVQEFDVTPYVQNNNVILDYGVSNAYGTSNYIVNQQIVSYGEIEFETDARISEIKSPNSAIEYGRINPACTRPIVVLENTGSNAITSAEFKYKINNGTELSYTWNGLLNFLEKAEVYLPVNEAFWVSSQTGNTNEFSVKLEHVNAAPDEYALNNLLKSQFEATEILEKDLILRFKTNNAANESKFKLLDSDGNIYFERINMSNNTIYNDTFNLSTGCYTLLIEDSGNDGVSFWANSDGSGYIQLKKITGQTIKSFQADFGSSLRYEFSVTEELGLIENEEKNRIQLIPNPSSDKITIQSKGFENGNWIIVDCLGKIINEGKTENNAEQNETINIQALKNGMYWLKITNDKNSETISFVKI